MTAQIAFIITIALSIIMLAFNPYNSLLLLIILIASFLVTITITGRRYLDILKDHLQRVFIHFREGEQNTGQKRLGNPIRLFFMNPWLILLFLLILNKGSFNYSLISLSSLIIIALLSVFWVWGSGPRHFYFASTIITAMIVEQIGNELSVSFQIIIMLLSLFSLFLIIRDFKAQKSNILSKDLIACFNFLKNKKGDLVLVLPNIACPALLYFTDKKIFSAAHGSKALTFNKGLMKKNRENIHFLENLIKKYKINWVILNKTTSSRLDKKSFAIKRSGFNYDTNTIRKGLSLKQSFVSGDYSVCKT
jgi:uncharacterized membrane protein YhaH (DUF805 family)